MRPISLALAAVGTLGLLASSALAQHGSSRHGPIASSHGRGGEVSLYRDAARRSSPEHGIYQTASYRPGYGHSSRYSCHGHGYRPYRGYWPYHPPVVIRPPIMIPRPVIVPAPYYQPQPYYYPRSGISYYGRNFSIGIDF